MAGNIVLGYDGSDGSKAALRVAVAVARAFDAPLSVVFGYEPPPYGGESSDLRNALHKIGEDWVDEAIEAAHREEPSLDTEKLVVPMRPVDALIEAATERDARAIVVGGMGEAPILGAILGSVPHKLLHRAKVPVLVVPIDEP